MTAAFTITTITIIIFVAIVCYHIWNAVTTSQTVKKHTRNPLRQREDIQENPIDGSGNVAQPTHAPTTTYTNMSELRESLLS